MDWHVLFHYRQLVPLMNRELSPVRSRNLRDWSPWMMAQNLIRGWVRVEKWLGSNSDSRCTGSLREKKRHQRRSPAHSTVQLRRNSCHSNCFQSSCSLALHGNRWLSLCSHSFSQCGTKQTRPVDIVTKPNVYQTFKLPKIYVHEKLVLVKIEEFTWKLCEPWPRSSERRYSCMIQSVRSPKGARPQ